MPDPRRTYFNTGDNTPYVVGVPRVRGAVTDARIPCPHCGCATLYDIEVTIHGHPLLASPGGKGLGAYIGCPACPFASPMLIRAT